MATVMILAAGLGTRLRPLTDELPKPLVPVGDAPLVVQIARSLVKHGATRLLMNTHHRAEAFSALRSPLPTELVHEPEILGTAGAVANVRPRLEPGEPLLVWNGDIFASIDVSALASALSSTSALAAWSVSPRPSGQGTVGLDERGRVVRVRGYRRPGEVRGGDFLGVSLLSPSLIERLPTRGCLVGDSALPLLEQGAEIVAVEHRGAWDDVGSVPAYLQANARWLEEAGLRSYVGEGASIGEAEAEGSVIGAGAVVEGRGALSGCVVWPGARATAPLSGAVVTPGGLSVTAG